VSQDRRPAGLAIDPAPHLAERRVAGSLSFDGVLLKIYRDEAVAADGHACIREYTLHPGASAIVPILPNGNLLLERQWRYPLNRSFLEFPAGKLDAGEDPLDCAARELREETGYLATRWARLGPMHPVISYSTEVIHLFLATGMKPSESSREAGECLELIEIPPHDFLARAEAGEVSDAKTLSAAFWIQRILSGQFQPRWIYRRVADD
jgi:ADP-ribose pyrophosphatase